MGYRLHYVCEDDIVINYVFKDQPDKTLRDLVLSCKSRLNIMNYHHYYQVKVRQHLKNETLQYVERRWSTFWTYSYSVTAIAFAFFATTAYLWPIKRDPDESIAKYLIIVLMIFYVLLAIYHAWKSRRDANRIERIVMLNAVQNRDDDLEILYMKRK